MASEIPPINPPLPVLDLIQAVLEIVLMLANLFADAVCNLAAMAIFEAPQNCVDDHPAKTPSKIKSKRSCLIDALPGRPGTWCQVQRSDRLADEGLRESDSRASGRSTPDHLLKLPSQKMERRHKSRLDPMAPTFIPSSLNGRDTFIVMSAAKDSDITRLGSEKTGVSGHSLVASPLKNKESCYSHPPELVDEDAANNAILPVTAIGEDTWTGTSAANDGRKVQPSMKETGVSGQSLTASPPPPPRNNKKLQVHPSSTDDGGRQQQLAHPTTIDLIHHGYEIVEMEKVRYGRKTMIWRIQYRNRDGLLLSLLWSYWSRSWMQGIAIYIITHGLPEIALWYSLGRQFPPTFGKTNVHPSDNEMAMQTLSTNKESRRNIGGIDGHHIQQEQEDSLKAKPAAALEIKLTNGEATTISRNKYQAMASTIITLAKGKWKTVDRPKRYWKWQQKVNAKSLLSTKAKAVKVKPSTTPHPVIVQQLTTATISSPMLNDLDDMTEIQSTSTHDEASLELNRMETSFCETKKTSTIATRLFMDIVFRKLLAIHDNQKRFMADCGAWPGFWANVGIIHQHQRDLSRAANPVLAGFYPRDFIKWT